MRIYFSHSRNCDYENDFYTPIRSHFKDSDHELILPHENGKDDDTRAILPTCDLLVAEVSHPATGIGIELGRAEASEIPIACIHKAGANPSSSLYRLSDDIWKYDSPETMLSIFDDLIKKYENLKNPSRRIFSTTVRKAEEIAIISIYETNHFVLEAHPQPEIDRLEGGHMKISPKNPIEDRSRLTPKQAIELMRLTIVAGLALKAAMAEIGIEIGRINYQDNGNWKPSLHIHLYGRAKNAVMQKYGDPFIPGHKPEYSSLTEDDLHRIRKHIEQLFAEDRYSDDVWGLS